MGAQIYKSGAFPVWDTNSIRDCAIFSFTVVLYLPPPSNIRGSTGCVGTLSILSLFSRMHLSL